MEKKMELYVHIPFCVKKCAYCDFLSAPADEQTIRQYVRGLQQEIRLYGSFMRDKGVSTIFIGGGTPSSIDATYIGEIMDTIYHYFSVSEDAEITMEANPGTLTKERLLRYKKSGINRLSLGLQSANDEELKKLGRIHSYQQFLNSYDLARKAGFENINIDLMSALPGQSVSSWEQTLKKVLSLKPEHISAYSLIIEEGTPFYRLYEEDEKKRRRGETPDSLPGEEEERAMYMVTGELLAHAGYERYEISNYAKAGYECRHNLGYWTRVPYLGLGLGASSFLEETRWSNRTDLEGYLQSVNEGTVPAGEKTVLDRKDAMEEFMFLGLRLIKGVEREEFFQRFHTQMEGVYGDVLPKLYQAGLLAQSEGRIFLTEEGIDISNYVLSEFLLT